MCRPSKEGVKGLPHQLNLLSGYRDASISILNFLNTNLHLIIAQRDIVDGCRPLINSFKGNQAGMIVINIQPTFLLFTRVWVMPRGIENTSLCADTGNGRTNLRRRRQYESMGVHRRLDLGEGQRQLSSHLFSDRLLQLVPDFLCQLLQLFGSDGCRSAGAF